MKNISIIFFLSQKWDISSDVRRKYFYIDELLPVHDVDIRLNGFKVKKDLLPFQNKQLEVDYEHDTITVSLVNIDEIVLLDIDEQAVNVLST